MNLKIPDYIQAIDPYVPGKPLEELEREYGISDSIKLASNENPLGPSPKALAAIRNRLATLHRYPDGAGHRLTGMLADANGVSPANVVIGNGSDDIIALLIRALIRPGDRVIVPRPSFLMYTITAAAAGAVVDAVPLKALAMDLDAMAERVNDDTRLVFVCNPNNPTGTVVTQNAFDDFMARLPDDVVVVVDEAYIDFVSNPDCLKTGQPSDVNRPLVTLRTFSKAYGLAGLRVGYGIMPAELAEVLNRVRQQPLALGCSEVLGQIEPGGEDLPDAGQGRGLNPVAAADDRPLFGGMFSSLVTPPLARRSTSIYTCTISGGKMQGKKEVR